MKPNTSRPLRTPIVLGLLLSTAGVVKTGAAGGSMWREELTASLLGDTRARKVGDLVTVVVQESNEANKANNTKTAKKTGINASISSFLFGAAQDRFLTRGGKYPAMQMNSDNSFDGGGSIANSERINTRIAVRVAEQLPNGNLVLEGRRSTMVAGEQQEAILRGVVRQEDIQPDNTVFSYNVADANLKFVSKGTVSDSQKRGWFTRIFEKVTPF
jgi:flagellar L-ring protein precursor FlgH